MSIAHCSHDLAVGDAIVTGPYRLCSSVGKGFASPHTPLPIVAAKLLLHYWFSPPLRSSGPLIVSSRTSPRWGGPLSFLFGIPSSLGGSRWADEANLILFSFVVTSLSRLAPLGRPGQLVPPLSHVGELRSPTPPPIVGSPLGFLLHWLFSLASRSLPRCHRRSPDPRLPKGRRDRWSPLPPRCSLASSRWVRSGWVRDPKRSSARLTGCSPGHWPGGTGGPRLPLCGSLSTFVATYVSIP